MAPSDSGPRNVRGGPLVAMAMIVIMVAGMRSAQSILSPFLLAAFLAVVCFPPLTWLQQKRVPGWAALMVVIGAGLLIAVLVITLVGTSLTDFSEKLPEYQQRLAERTEQVETRLVAWLEDKGIDAPEVSGQEGLDSARVIQLARMVIGPMGNLSSNMFIILLMFIFILVEASILPSKLQAMPGYSAVQGDQYSEILENVRQYVGIKTMLSLLTGALVTVLLMILGVDYAVLWGILAFFFNFVPNIGSFIAAVPAVVIALLQHGPAEAGYAALGYVVINVLVGNVLEPRIMGRGLGLSTLVVFLSLIFWGWVLGPVGMLLSVPLTMILKIVLDGHESTRWIAILLAADAPESS